MYSSSKAGLSVTANESVHCYLVSCRVVIKRDYTVAQAMRGLERSVHYAIYIRHTVQWH